MWTVSHSLADTCTFQSHSGYTEACDKGWRPQPTCAQRSLGASPDTAGHGHTNTTPAHQIRIPRGCHAQTHTAQPQSPIRK